jgi:ubiquinol-cytochrome c reductase cytochrome b subunit
MLLYAWPFLEARLTGDHDPHHLLDRARDHPMRTALGVAALSFYVVLFVAASNDLLARWMTLPVLGVTWFFRIAVLVVPPLAGWVTYRLMKGLRASGVDRFRHLPLSAVVHPSRKPPVTK